MRLGAGRHHMHLAIVFSLLVPVTHALVQPLHTPQKILSRYAPAVLKQSEEDGSGGAVIATTGSAGAWVQQNLLQGVELNPGTYAVMTVYFVQGILGLASLARTYFMKDTLGLSPAETSALLGITSLPWVIKPVYGFMTDGLPIFGYRRKPYLVLAGLIGTSSWAALATVVTTPTQAVIASTLASLGVAVSDVVVDSLVVERAREDESASSGALQSLCWSCQALGGLTSAYFSGSLLQSMPPQQIFGLTAVFPLLVVAMAFQLDEKRIVTAPQPSALADIAESTEGSLVGASDVEMPSGDFGTLVREQGGLLWQAVSQRSVWLPTLFIALWQATPSSEGQPSPRRRMLAISSRAVPDVTDVTDVTGRHIRHGQCSPHERALCPTPPTAGAFFYFITDELGIGPEFLGRVRVGTSIASLVGIWLYRTYLQEVPLKKLFATLSVSGAVLGLTQLLLVTRANLALGIPDTWFTFGDDLILTVLGQLAFMPLLVLAASLCPPGVEGTLFGARTTAALCRPCPELPVVRATAAHHAHANRAARSVADVGVQWRGYPGHRVGGAANECSRRERGQGRRRDRLHKPRAACHSVQPLVAPPAPGARISR